MGTIPRKTSELLAFCEERAPIWALSSAAIGIPSDLATQFTSVTTAASASVAAQVTAVSSAQAATATAQADVAALRETLGEALKVIRAFAETVENPTVVFTTAKIPPTKPRSPIGPPGTPKDYTMSVDLAGRLHLTWKCQNPPGSMGVLYMIERRLNQAGAWALLGAVAEREYLDGTIPSGTGTVEYRITGHRAGTVGLPGTFTAKFGTTDGGGLTLFSLTEGSGKAAA